MIVLEIKVDQALFAKLKEGANLSDVQNIVAANGREGQAKSQRYAPVDTGDLRRAITMNISGGGYTATVASTIKYAKFQEFGTRFQSGTPHIRPMFHQQKHIFISDLSRVLKSR